MSAKAHDQRLVGLFAGSFDPLTRGHLDLIARASPLFGRVWVAVGTSRDKVGVFTVEERLALIRAACQDLPNVEAVHFSGLAVEFAIAKKADVLIRGLRSGTDFDYEMQMAQMNSALRPQVQTVFLPTQPDLRHISSSLAKEIARLGGPVELLVPPVVAQALKAKMASL